MTWWRRVLRQGALERELDAELRAESSAYTAQVQFSVPSASVV